MQIINSLKQAFHIYVSTNIKTQTLALIPHRHTHSPELIMLMHGGRDWSWYYNV